MKEVDIKNLKKYLPIGTIVKLKTGKRKVMITGFCLYDHDAAHTLYDYCGCAYPEGMLSTNEVNLFNHGDIEKVFHLGVSDEEEKKFKVNLGSMIQIIEHKPIQEKEEDEYNEEEIMQDDSVVVGIDN
jgi:hypothetical protein